MCYSSRAHLTLSRLFFHFLRGIAKKMNRLTICLLMSLFALEAHAAPMVRVIDVTDSRTIVVDRSGLATRVVLAGVVVPPGDESAAIEFLRKTIGSSWVLVEPDPEQGEPFAYVYRSPDALFVNGEIARRAYLAKGPSMTYLGEVNPGPQRATRPAPSHPRRDAVRSTVHRARRTPRGAHRVPCFR